MNSQGDINRKSNIIIYTTEDGLAKIDTTFDGDTVWLSIDQMAELFQRDRSVIGNYSVQGIPTEYDVQIEYLQDKGGYMKKASYLQCEFDGASFVD